MILAVIFTLTVLKKHHALGANYFAVKNFISCLNYEVYIVLVLQKIHHSFVLFMLIQGISSFR